MVRFIDEGASVFSTIRDANGLIQPKVAFYTPPSDLSIISSGTYDIHSSDKRPHSAVITMHDDTTETAESKESQVNALRPLEPAYQSINMLHISTMPHALSLYLREDEITLPPGYIRHLITKWRLSSLHTNTHSASLE